MGIKTGDIMKTVETGEYPYFIEVLEIHPCGTKALCRRDEVKGCCIEDYNLKDLRYTSAKEISADVFKYYQIEEPSGIKFYSQDFIEWLESEVSNYETFIKQTIEESKLSGISMAELKLNKLCEFNQAAEKAQWFTEIVKMIKAEADILAEEGTTKKTISVPVPELYGKFVANASADTSYPGIDVEFIPDEEKNWVSNPRVLFEAHEDGEIDVHIWTNPYNEDYTLRNNFKLQ